MIVIMVQVIFQVKCSFSTGSKNIWASATDCCSFEISFNIMAGINKVILVGHLGNDPDLRYLDGNVAVANFSLATSETHMKNGVKEAHTEWHNIILWRTLAEAAVKILKKGKLIYVEGKCRTRSFEHDGVKRYTTEIVAESFTVLGRPADFEDEASKHIP